MELNLPSKLARLVKDYKITKDEIGLSPTNVFRLVNEKHALYLKISGRQFRNTTYSVERDKNILLWLEGKINVPRVQYFEFGEEFDYLLMSEIEGDCLSQVNSTKPDRLVELYAESVKRLQSIDITNCPYNSNVRLRLSELDYLLDNKLAAEEDFWEGDTKSRFASPGMLVSYLKDNIPEEDFVFSHGDLCSSNIITKNGSISGYVDWARGGKADRWYDIAFCVRNIRAELNDEKYVKLFFDILGIKPVWEKIDYFILLDELF